MERVVADANLNLTYMNQLKWALAAECYQIQDLERLLSHRQMLQASLVAQLSNHVPALIDHTPQAPQLAAQSPQQAPVYQPEAGPADPYEDAPSDAELHRILARLSRGPHDGDY